MTSGRGIVLPHDWFPRSLPANVVLGERTWIYSAFAFLHCRSRQAAAVTVGHDTGLYNGTMFCLGPSASVAIGNYGTLVGAIFSTDGRVVIGDHALIAHRVVLAGRSAAAPFGATHAAVGEDKDIVIGNNVWIGANATVLGGVRIGDNAVVGAGAVVDAEVPAGAVVVGNPAKIVRSSIAAHP